MISFRIDMIIIIQPRLLSDFMNYQSKYTFNKNMACLDGLRCDRACRGSTPFIITPHSEIVFKYIFCQVNLILLCRNSKYDAENLANISIALQPMLTFGTLRGLL